MRRALVIAPAVALLGVLGYGLFTTAPGIELGKAAPAFSLPRLDDPQARLGTQDLKGRPAVVNFWASWCEPCKDEAPELVRAATGAGDRVRFIGVSILDGREEALRAMRELHIPYESVRDASGRVSKRYGVTGVPETVFLDRDGRVAGRFIGALGEGQLTTIVGDLEKLASGARLRITGRGETRPVP